MANILTKMLKATVSRKVANTTEIGVSGIQSYGGVIQEYETDPSLAGTRKYKVYSDMLANISIVAAGTRYFLNLVSKSDWTFEPSEADVDGKYAKLVEGIFMDDMDTSFNRVVRRASMYKFYGFSVQEWTVRRREDGVITFKDIAPRAQRTIERWELGPKGEVLGIFQTNPQTGQEVLLPRGKVLYIVDDSLDDSPMGLGLFRHLVAPAKRLSRYEDLEGIGFETDLRGIPVGRGPFSQMAQMVQDGTMTKETRAAAEKPMRDFISGHIKSAKLGLLLDSMTYESQDEKAFPSAQKQWDISLLKASANSLEDNAKAISRLNREMARILGVEQLLLGEGSGSYALSKDKTQSFFMLIDSTLKELAEQFERDLLTVLWDLNGWDPAMVPKICTEATRFQDVEEAAKVLKDMATAGATLHPEDPVVNEVRDLLGFARTDPALLTEMMMNESLLGDEPDEPDEPEEAAENKEGENVKTPKEGKE